MAPEPSIPDPSEKQHKSLDREIKELISALTTRIGSIQRPINPDHKHASDEDEQGVRVITLAGNNQGATMRAGDADSSKTPVGMDPAQPDQDEFATYVNSNFQAINNSIMLGGSYRTKDPGVHLDISDCKGHVGNGGRRNKRRSPKSEPRQAAEHTEETVSSSDGDD